MTILVTGVAGFIGFHVSKALLERGEKVVGIDNLNDYYDVGLKKSRLEQLKEFEDSDNFKFIDLDVENFEKLSESLKNHRNDITKVIHLAAQAGVRYSLEKPFAYANSNVLGQLSILELCRNLKNLEHLVYASSSSVYGGSDELPYSIEQRTDKPISLYAATKKSAELISYSYANLYKIPMTGLRFFTVYGPWGRPDMAYFLFTKAIIESSPIKLFEEGKLKRDFTYIDDIVEGVLAAIDKAPRSDVPYAIYNLGNDKSETVSDFVKVLEGAIGIEAIKENVPMQPGDMKETHADISRSREDLGYDPKTSIEEGLQKFVEWYKEYYGAKEFAKACNQG